jgi:hypothetical protein
VAASGHFEFDVRGEEQVERNAAKLDPDARKGITKEKKRLAKNLAAKLRRAVISGSKTTIRWAQGPPDHPPARRDRAGRAAPDAVRHRVRHEQEVGLVCR